MNERKLFQMLVLSGLVILGIVLLGIVLWATRSLWPPTVAGLLTAYMLFPVMRWTGKIGVPRWFSVIAIMALMGGLLSLIAYTVIPFVTEELSAFVESAPVGNEQSNGVDPLDRPDAPPVRPRKPKPLQDNGKSSALLNILQETSRYLKGYGVIKEEWEAQAIRDKLNQWVAGASNELFEILSVKAIQAGNFLMIYFFVLIFGLLDGHVFQKSMVSLLPNSIFEAGIFVLNNTTKMFGDYIRGVAVETLILGLVCLGLLLPICFLVEGFDLKIAIIISVIIALTNIVRIVGPIFGGLGCCVIAFSTTSDLKAAFGVLLVALIVQLLDNVLVLPLVMEDQMAIHPVLCLLGVLAGGILGGVLGMALAIPVIGGIKVVYRVISVELHKFNYGNQPYYVYADE